MAKPCFEAKIIFWYIKTIEQQVVNLVLLMKRCFRECAFMYIVHSMNPSLCSLHAGQAGHAEEVIFYDEKGNCCESTKAIYMNYLFLWSWYLYDFIPVDWTIGNMID